MGVKPLRHLGDDDVEPRRAQEPDEIAQEPEEDARESGEKPTVGKPQRSTGSTAVPPPRKPSKVVLSWVREILIVAVGALIVSMLLRIFVFQLFEIPSESMENTLLVGDKIVVLKPATVERGDVVVFEDPAGWLPPSPGKSAARVVLEWTGLAPDTSRNHLVKRVIGMPGDTVECCAPSGNLLVNGVEIHEGDYLYSEGNLQVRPSDFPFKVVVPADHYFVMGDHRNRSQDSRCWLQSKGIDAFVPKNRIVGPVKQIIAPLDRWQSISGKAAFAHVPAPPPAPARPVIEAGKVTC